MPNKQCIYIFADPNGAGKTTFAREYLSELQPAITFVNADLIAASLSPHAPEAVAMAAGRLMLSQIDQLAAKGMSFAFETTLSARSYAPKIQHWLAAQYEVNLLFLSLPNARAAKQRVALRVRQGGHNIPAEVIERRFAAGLMNFENLYKPLVSRWTLYDGHETPPRLIASSMERTNG